MMAKLPDFIIIGAMKCGTTSLWRNLDRHPGITMGKNYDDPKKTSTEIRFFNNAGPYHNWNRGVEWYKQCFRGDYGGEKCANYVESAKAIQRMKNIVPSVKLILCIRNPIDRAYSEYFMQLDTHPRKYPPAFDVAIKKNKGYQHRGKYYQMLEQNVLPFFSRDQIYIIVQERVKSNTLSEMNKLYDFLGLPHHDEKIVRVTFKNRDSVVDGYRQWSSNYRQKIKPSTLQWMKELYVKPNDRLFDFLGERIEEWK